jgi:hypothetical protein
MMITDIERHKGSTLGNAGLAFIGEMARISGLDGLVDRESRKKQPRIKEHEIFRTLAALLSQGKTDFDHVREYYGDDFFSACLGLERIPSAEIMRQRFQSIAQETDLGDKLPQCSIELWKRSGMKPVLITADDGNTKESWARLDIDVSIYDNSDTKKEKARPTYDNRFGFAPIFAHLDGGWMVHSELRPGSSHSSCEGTDEFFLESIGYARSMVDSKILVVADSGFDSKERMKKLIAEPCCDFIIKHNLRRVSKDEWLAKAKEHSVEVESYSNKREKGRIYRGSIASELGQNHGHIRQVFEITEILSKNKRPLIIPEIRVCVLWTSLELSPKQVLVLYRQRGTSEQYHSELKTDMDMERLPSGKFAVNAVFLRLGMLVYNMLRVASTDIIAAHTLGLKKATRRRTRTVMRSVMGICGRIVRHARRTKLYISCSEPWHEVVRNLFLRLKFS